MDRYNIFSATALVAALTIPTIANSALVGRLADSNGNYQAYYDTEADLTWLADANYAATSGYSEAFGTGEMSWDTANIWAASLDISGTTDWRLPDTDACIGYCTDSEMGNLFHNVLGGTLHISIITAHNSNYELFSNIQTPHYWSATEGVGGAYLFDFGNGGQSFATPGSYFYAWAVHDGDVANVSAVPIPPSVFLFLSGLAGLIGFARKKQ